MELRGPRVTAHPGLYSDVFPAPGVALVNPGQNLTYFTRLLTGTKSHVRHPHTHHSIRCLRLS